MSTASDLDALRRDPAQRVYRAEMLLSQNNGAEAAELYRAVADETDDPAMRYGALLGLARALGILRRSADAEAVCREAIALQPAGPAAYALRALALKDLERFDEAATAIAVALDTIPDSGELLKLAAAIALQRKQPAESLAFSERVLAVDPFDQRALGDTAIAFAELGRDADADRLLDFDRLLKSYSVAAPDGYASIAAFNADLAAAIVAHPDLLREEDERTLVRGSRLGDTFELDSPLAGAMHDLLLDAVEAYARELAVDPAHPVALGRPPRFRITSWSNVMEASAFERPHIHESGWLSGVYYPETPGVAEGSEAGAIVFGGHPYGPTVARSGPRRVIAPRPGQLLLFPSYFYHGTVPFEGGGRRISVAFDVARKGRGR